MKPTFERQLREFGFGTTYIHGYVARRVAEQGAAAAWDSADSLEAFCEQSPAVAGYARFVLSTLWRGQNIVRNLDGTLTPNHRRMLDVGCGFGGSLVAFAKHGLQVTGIELDGERAEAARLLLADQGARGEVRTLDVYSDAFQALGSYDVIVAENVVEHVDDPKRFLSALSGRLGPGGVMYLEVPNSRSAQYVASDPHYNLPLLTLLGHHSAKATFAAMIGSKVKGARYEVGEYYPLRWYERLLRELRYAVTSRPHPHATRTREQFAALFVQIANAAAQVSERYVECDPFLRDELQRVAWDYLSSAASACCRDLTSGDADFETTYLADAWIVVATKRGDA